MADDPSRTVSVALTPDEALVLFDFLQRFSRTDALSLADPAEERALWNLCSLLERVLVEPFDANYQHLLEQARTRLRDVAA